MNKKGEMKITDGIIWVFVFCIVVVSFSLILTDFNNNYSTNINTSPYASYGDYLEEGESSISDPLNSGLETDPTSENEAEDNIIKSSWNNIKRLLSTFNILKDISTSANRVLSIPQIIVTGLLTIFITLLAVAFYNWIRGRSN